MNIEHQAAAFLVRVAQALAELGDGTTDYGNFYVHEVQIGFEGDVSNYKIVPNEHGGFDITGD